MTFTKPLFQKYIVNVCFQCQRKTGLFDTNYYLSSETVLNKSTAILLIKKWCQNVQNSSGTTSRRRVGSLQTVSDIKLSTNQHTRNPSIVVKNNFEHLKVQKMFHMNQNFLFYKPNYYLDLDWIENLYQSNFACRLQRPLLDKTFLLVQRCQE